MEVLNGKNIALESKQQGLALVRSSLFFLSFCGFYWDVLITFGIGGES
jgi:hypothetical protein